MSDLETAEVPDRQLVSRCGCIGRFAYEYPKPPVIERFLPGMLSPHQPTL